MTTSWNELVPEPLTTLHSPFQPLSAFKLVGKGRMATSGHLDPRLEALKEQIHILQISQSMTYATDTDILAE